MVTGLQAASGQGSPSRIGGYVLRRWLAQGGMAELYLATPSAHERGHEIVVVKRVLPQFAQDRQFMRMFAREAQLAAILDHPNIVEVIDDGHLETEDPDACYFAMEYVHGADLSAVMRKLREHNGTIPLANALFITMGICAGLHHAHQLPGEDGVPLGIIHRDVSPSNVLLSTEGEVKITDFGVAKALALTSFTQAGTRKGKLSYMSPEQAVADPVDCRTDVFAIGAVLYELTTMQRMFGGENELAVMHKLLFRDRPRPSEIMANYPPELEAIVMKATAHDPNERFPTAAAMRDAIIDFAQRQGLVPSQEALGRFVRSVLQPPPHPAEDPEFFQDHEGGAPKKSSSVEQEGTVPEGRNPLTRPGGGAYEVPTSLDGVPSSPGSDPGNHVSAPAQGRATEAYPVVPPQPATSAHHPAAPVHHPATPPPQAVAGSMAAPVPVRFSAHGPTVAPPGAKRSKAVLIGVSAGVFVMVLSLGGALAWQRMSREQSSAATRAPATESSAENQVAPVEPPPDARAAPIGVAQPIPAEPTEVSPQAPPPTEAPGQQPETANPPASPELPDAADPQSQASHTSKHERDDDKRSKSRRKKADSSKSSTHDNSKSDAKRDPPPPPPPPDGGDDKKKKRKPTDTLLPIVE